MAGPLFSSSELSFNRELAEHLHNAGHKVLLPQDSCPPFSDIIDSGRSPSEALELVFEKDMEMLRRADLLLFVLDGRVPDEGACFELGYAYATGIDLVGIKTDSRSSIDGMDNAMLAVPLKGRIAKDIPGLLDIISNLHTKT